MQQKLVMNREFEGLPLSLIAVISLLEEIVSRIRQSIHQHMSDHSSAFCTDMPCDDDMWLIYRWDSSGPQPSLRVQVSPAFCRNIAGLTNPVLLLEICHSRAAHYSSCPTASTALCASRRVTHPGLGASIDRVRLGKRKLMSEGS